MPVSGNVHVKLALPILLLLCCTACVAQHVHDQADIGAQRIPSVRHSQHFQSNGPQYPVGYNLLRREGNDDYSSEWPLRLRREGSDEYSSEWPPTEDSHIPENWYLEQQPRITQPQKISTSEKADHLTPGADTNVASNVDFKSSGEPVHVSFPSNPGTLNNPEHVITSKTLDYLHNMTSDAPSKVASHPDTVHKPDHVISSQTLEYLHNMVAKSSPSAVTVGSQKVSKSTQESAHNSTAIHNSTLGIKASGAAQPPQSNAGFAGTVTVSTKYSNTVHTSVKRQNPTCEHYDRRAFMSFLIRNMSLPLLSRIDNVRMSFEEECAKVIAFAAGSGDSVPSKEVELVLRPAPFGIAIDATVNTERVCASDVIASLTALTKNIESLLKKAALAQRFGLRAAIIGAVSVEVVIKPILVPRAYTYKGKKNVSTIGITSLGKELGFTYDKDRPVHCGAHWAKDCNSCPKGQGATWCNGDCTWSPYNSLCVFKWQLIWCGGHVANSCSACVWAGTTYQGRNWCNGECYWLKGECYAKHPGAPPMPRAPTRSLTTTAQLSTITTVTTTEQLNTLPPIFTRTLISSTTSVAPNITTTAGTYSQPTVRFTLKDAETLKEKPTFEDSEKTSWGSWIIFAVVATICLVGACAIGPDMVSNYFVTSNDRREIQRRKTMENTQDLPKEAFEEKQEQEEAEEGEEETQETAVANAAQTTSEAAQQAADAAKQAVADSAAAAADGAAAARENAAAAQQAAADAAAEASERAAAAAEAAQKSAAEAATAARERAGAAAAGVGSALGGAASRFGFGGRPADAPPPDAPP